ncbi:MAG: DedA family protein [Acidobacteria bacterium 13_1_20CM_3_53_8]|nr:MAG: DedA family protein [Acidobacteria bacterium 13_1_20CM_3_53_8]
MTEQLLGLLSTYGLPALFIILTIASAGMPFPVTLLLIISGSFAAQGELVLWKVLVVCSAGAVAGDQIGYWLGRWGGRKLVHRLAERFGGVEMIMRAEAFNKRWGSVAVFLSRWLVTPLGPWLNLTSGISKYSWPRFLFWDVSGEVLWVVLYAGLGYIFNDRVGALADLLGNLTWVIVGVIAAGILGWKLLQYFRGGGESSEKTKVATEAYSTATEG